MYRDKQIFLEIYRNVYRDRLKCIEIDRFFLSIIFWLGFLKLIPSSEKCFFFYDKNAFTLYQHINTVYE